MRTIEEPNLHRFSADEYYRLGELGLLSSPTELIEGIITDMEPIGPWHADILTILDQIFHARAAGRYAIRIQQPIELGPLSLPQPDLVLCQPGRYRDRHPSPADISLLIELSDTSLSFDLGQKLALYKAAEIAEYWIIDLQAKLVHCFCAPDYAHERLTAIISPVSWPDIRINLGELFA
jgi:Uma2 family endonuclease